MAKLLAINQFFDASGLALASGKVYTYITGSSTPKTTFTDATESTHLANPVVLSSGGRAEIWLATDQAYRLVIKDANGNQIGNAIDNVVPVTTLAAATGASNIDITGYSILTTSGDLMLAPVSGSKVSISGTFKLPSDAPSSGQVLTGSSGGTTVWSSPTAGALDLISDVTAPTPTNGDLLKYRSSDGQWINSAQSTLAITASQVTDLGSSATAFTNKSGAISQWTNDSSYATFAAIAAANYVTTTSASALSNKTGNISQWTNDSAYLAAGSQADLEAATSNTVAATPGRLQNHPGVAKAWVVFPASNPPTLSASYNIASVVRNSVGNYTITFTTAFSSANYACIIGTNTNSGGNPQFQVSTRTTTTVVILCTSGGAASDAGVNAHITFFGDQ